MARAVDGTRKRLRWETVDGDGRIPRLFDTTAERITHPEFRDLEFIHVAAKSVINEVPAPARLPFRYTINVYRGCSHACVYCFARPTHEYLNLDSGRDFERVIVVKVNAPELLRRELHPSRWAGGHIAMGTNTDPYQRCEGRYRLTRQVLEVLTEFSNPFSILTKSALVLRDLEVLREANERTDISVSFSIGTLDTAVWRATEPGTPHPRKRVDAIAALRDAGIPAGVLIAPVIPGVSDGRDQLEDVVEACVEAGATSITPLLLHLRPGVKQHFTSWIEHARPELLPMYTRLYPRSYAPSAERGRLAELVRELVLAHGGPKAAPPSRGRSIGAPRATAQVSWPEGEQLSLDL